MMVKIKFVIVWFVGSTNLQTEREKPKKLHEVNRTSLYQTPGKVMWNNLRHSKIFFRTYYYNCKLYFEYIQEKEKSEGMMKRERALAYAYTYQVGHLSFSVWIKLNFGS